MAQACACGTTHEWTSPEIILSIWATLGPNVLSRFVTVFNDFTSLKITGEEYTDRIRECVPADHLHLVNSLVDALVNEATHSHHYEY